MHDVRGLVAIVLYNRDTASHPALSCLVLNSLFAAAEARRLQLAENSNEGQLCGNGSVNRVLSAVATAVHRLCTCMIQWPQLNSRMHHACVFPEDCAFPAHTMHFQGHGPCRHYLTPRGPAG